MNWYADDLSPHMRRPFICPPRFYHKPCWIGSIWSQATYPNIRKLACIPARSLRSPCVLPTKAWDHRPSITGSAATTARVLELTRLFRLFAAHQDWAEYFLDHPTVRGVAGTSGIELHQPWREDRADWWQGLVQSALAY